MTFQFAFGPRIKKSAFFDATVRAGVSHFSTYNHVCFPVSYGDPVAEYRRLTEGVSMWDVSVERQVRIMGKDALELASILTPRNLEKVKIGQGRYIPICDHRGILMNDPVMLPISANEYWISIADQDLLWWARAIAAERGMNVSIDEPDISPLAVQGPKASEVVRQVCGDWVDDLKFFGFNQTMIQGIPVVVAKSGWSKQGGFEIYLMDHHRGTELWDIIEEAGRPYDIGPGAPNYIERIESGLLSMGADTDDDTNPYEVGMGKLCDLEQDVDFIGKDALKRIKARGAKRRMTGYVIDGEKFSGSNQHRWKVYQDGKKVGLCSAAAYSPRLDANIGLGLIKVGLADEGNKVTIQTEYGEREATTTALPFKI
ncbi:MAG: glycine cleavage T C-terminal barrel domain-containing protein [Hyphomicrobiales bacterium]